MNINSKLKIFKCALQSGETPFGSVFIDTKSVSSLNISNWKVVLRKLHYWGVRNLTINTNKPETAKELISYATNTLGFITWLLIDSKTLNNIKHVNLPTLDFLSVACRNISLEDSKNIVNRLSDFNNKQFTPAILYSLSTSNINDTIEIAEYAAKKNILFDIEFLQSFNGEFSNGQNIERINSTKLKSICSKLSKIRANTGKVLASYKLLNEASDFYARNNWKCPKEKDPYIVINNKGILMPCQDFKSTISIFDIESLSDKKWRKEKNNIVDNCNGCSWSCYYQKTFRNPFDLLQESIALLKF